MANLSNLNNRFIVTDGGNALINATANLTTYGGLTIDNISNPSIAMKTNSASGWIYNQYITNTGTNNFSMGVNQTIPYWGVKTGAGMDNPALAIISSGNVGIGTISPAVKLQVYGSAMPATGDPASVEDLLTLYRNGSATVWSGGASLSLGRYSTGGGSAPKSRLDFKLKNAAGSNTALPETTVMTMQSNGNVGIGTTSPTQGKLDILNNGDYDSHTGHGLAINSYAGNAYTSMYMGADDTIDCVYIQSAGRNTSFTTKALLLNPNGGNVGIGTTSISERLTVDGNAEILKGDDARVYIKDVGDSSTILLRSDGANTSIGTDSNHDLQIHANSSEKMRVHTGGSITMGEFNSTNAPNNGILKIKTGGSTAGTCYPLLSIMGSTHLATRQYGIGMDPEGYSNRVKMFFGVDGNGNGYSFGDFVWNINTVANNDAVTPSDEKMRLNKLGYLGLGGSAAVKLEVFNGSLRVRGSLANSIELSNTSGNTRAALGLAGNEGDLSLYRSNNSKYVYLSSYYNCYIDPQQSSAVVGIGGAGVGIVSSGPGGNTTLDVQGPLRNKRVMRGWFHCGPITSGLAYRHIKTNLWMGGGPTGNTEYIMGGFEAKGYAYYGSYPGFGHGTCMFHNWSGGFASLQVANYGTAGFMQQPYVSTDGYCVIVLRQNSYMQPVIDFSQYYTPYPWRTSYVTAESASANLTGVY